MGQSEIIPVMDIMNGQVVHGIAGKRNAYRPIVSSIVKGADPLDVAEAFKDIFDVNRVYIADLDAIRGIGNNIAIVTDIVDTIGLEILLDGGARNATDIGKLLETGIQSAIVATETLASQNDLTEILQVHGASVVGSLDLMSGKTLSACREFNGKDPLSMARVLETSGIQKLIVLELSLVGTGQGPIHDGLIQICSNSSLDIIAGGGVRNRDDLHELFQIGAEAALVATALHQKTVQP
ncbi:MAG: HisA/HisF-related TIM barrel protein [Candidatus Thorarchaeota archaeon]|jgi:phosphoribosylformimino-5-aminoimidazole carboxamide ribotide isomerase